MRKFYETGAAAGMNHAQSKMFWKSEPWAVNHTPGQNKQSQAKLCNWEAQRPVPGPQKAI